MCLSVCPAFLLLVPGVKETAAILDARKYILRVEHDHSYCMIQVAASSSSPEHSLKFWGIEEHVVHALAEILKIQRKMYAGYQKMFLGTRSDKPLPTTFPIMTMEGLEQFDAALENDEERHIAVSRIRVAYICQVV